MLFQGDSRSQIERVVIGKEFKRIHDEPSPHSGIKWRNTAMPNHFIILFVLFSVRCLHIDIYGNITRMPSYDTSNRRFSVLHHSPNRLCRSCHLKGTRTTWKNKVHISPRKRDIHVTFCIRRVSKSKELITICVSDGTIAKRRKIASREFCSNCLALLNR